MVLSDLIIRNYCRRGELQGGGGHISAKMPTRLLYGAHVAPPAGDTRKPAQDHDKDLKGSTFTRSEPDGATRDAPETVGLRGFTQEDQDPGLSLEHCTTAMTDVISPSVGSYSSVIPAEDNEMHETTETDRRAELTA